MPIILPDFKNTLCQAIGTCGTIQTDDKQVLDVLAKVNGVLSAQYRAGNARPTLTAVLGQRDDKHVHIDIARKKVYSIGHDRGANSTIEEIQRHLDQLLGTDIKTVVFCRFVLPVEELPEQGLIRSLSFESLEDDLGITMTGGEFEIRGKVPYFLSWRLIEKKANVRVDLETYVAIKLNEEYLVRLLGHMDSAFRLYVLGKKPDVERSR